MVLVKTKKKQHAVLTTLFLFCLGIVCMLCGEELSAQNLVVGCIDAQLGIEPSVRSRMHLGDYLLLILVAFI
jgi:hypothetical protein